MHALRGNRGTQPPIHHAGHHSVGGLVHIIVPHTVGPSGLHRCPCSASVLQVLLLRAFARGVAGHLACGFGGGVRHNKKDFDGSII